MLDIVLIHWLRIGKSKNKNAFPRKEAMLWNMLFNKGIKQSV